MQWTETPTPTDPEAIFRHALQLLLKHARHQTGGSQRCAAFLLSLWNGSHYRCDLQSLLYIDEQIHQAMLNVFHYLYATDSQLDTWLSGPDMAQVIDLWGIDFQLDE